MKNEAEKIVKKQGYIIIFLERDRFDLYESVNGNTFSYPYPVGVINALDVINAEELQKQLAAFIDQNQINPADILIVVSPHALFEKDIYTKDMTPEEIETQTKNFISTVPFDMVYSKTINFAGGVRISAVNRALCDGIIYAFEKKGSHLNGIVPYEALGTDMSSITALDTATASYIIKSFDTLKSQSFPLDEGEKKPGKSLAKQALTTNDESVPEEEKKAPNKTRIYIMAGVFGVLVIILIYLVLNPPA